jgi:hypothetical protein
MPARRVPGARVEYTIYTIDDFIRDQAAQKWQAGEVQIGAESEGARLGIAVTSEVPVFLRCRVSYVTPDGDTLRATAGLGFAPEQIEPSLPVAEDFDAFWTEQVSEARTKVPPSMVPQPGGCRQFCPTHARLGDTSASVLPTACTHLRRSMRHTTHLRGTSRFSTNHSWVMP